MFSEIYFCELQLVKIILVAQHRFTKIHFLKSYIIMDIKFLFKEDKIFII